MTLKIGIGMSFYQDFDSLQRMLHSLQGYPFDMLIAIDGIYTGHPGRQTYSDKVVIDLFKTIQTPYQLLDMPPMSQIAKRQIYFEMSKVHGLDVIIVMDSDEYIIHNKTNWPLFVEELEQKIRENADTFVQGYTIPLQINQKRYAPNQVINAARVFHKPWELQYVDNHHTIRNKKTGVNMGYQSDRTVLTQLMIGTDHKLRTDKYMAQHDMYEDYQKGQEENPQNTKRRVDDFIALRDKQQNEIRTQ